MWCAVVGRWCAFGNEHLNVVCIGLRKSRSRLIGDQQSYPRGTMKIRLLAVVWLAISVPASVEQDAMKLIKADEIVWQEHPIFKGVQVVWMMGDPTKVELIVQRTEIPRITRFQHTLIPMQNSFILPAGHAHRTWTGDEETIVQVTFIDPSGCYFRESG